MIFPPIPIFAELSAPGAFLGVATGSVKAINDKRSAKYQLEESHLHIKSLEVISLGKVNYLTLNVRGISLHFKKN